MSELDMPRRSTSGGKHSVFPVGADYVKRRRAEFEGAIRKAFKDSRFLSTKLGKGVDTVHEYTTEDVVRSCLDSHTMHDPDRRAIVALGEGDKILGAVFHVPVHNRDGKKAGEYGWFFTSPELSKRRRIDVANTLMDETHRRMRIAGFRRVEISMGTEDGAKYLAKNHGYERTILGANSWFKKL
jgi:hypothetical protein